MGRCNDNTNVFKLKPLSLSLRLSLNGIYVLIIDKIEI